MKNDNLSLLFSISRINAIMSRRLSGHGLDFGDFMILYFLDRTEGKKLRRVDLAHKLGLTASGITRMLLPLEKLHIVKRDQSGDDARARYASLTEAGQQLFAEASATMQMRLEDALPADTENLTGKISAFLDDFTENLLEGEYRC